MLVWVHLEHVAVETQRTVYSVKHELLDDYLSQSPPPMFKCVSLEFYLVNLPYRLSLAKVIILISYYSL